MDKIIKVNFEEWQDIVYVDEGLVAWNYGEILQVEGLALPDGNIEVHFSLKDREGDANVYIGTVKDDVLTVSIPDFIFQKEDVYQPTYDAYAFIYQTDGDSGRTIKKITFTIKARPKPTTDTPEDQQDPFLQEVRQIMAETKEIAQSVRDDADAGKLGGGTNITVDSELSEESTNPVQNKVITAEVIALRERNAELEETVEKLQIKVTTEPSPYHHITDSANMKVVDFGMKGITEQETVPGNQLFDISTCEGFLSQYSGVSNEIDVENKTIITTNTHTSARTVACKLAYILAGTYTLSWNTSANYMQILSGEAINSLTPLATVTTGNNTTVTIDTDTYLWLQCIAVENGGITTTSDIMLNKGSTALPVEEYVGGMPSPNPEHEEEITLAGVYNEETGRYEHKCCVGNKNLATELIRGLLVDESGTISTVSTYYTDNYVNIKRVLPKGTYTIHIHGMKICIARYILNGKYVNLSSVAMDKFTFTVSDMSETIICFSKGDGNIFDGSELVQLEYKGSVTDYIEGKNQPFTLTSDRPLTKWDNLVKVDGKWYWDYKQLKLVVDGNKNWNAYTANDYCGFRCDGLDFNGSRKSGYCNQLIVETSVSKNSNRLWLGVSNNNNIYAVNGSYFDDTLEDKGLANWKAHLNEHPLEIYTYKDESELVPLLDEEQELLHNLETYYGVTNVYNEQGCPMWFKYCADQELHWNQKLLQIQQAII